MPDNEEKLWRELKTEIKQKYTALTDVDVEYIFQKFKEIHQEEEVGESELISEFNDFAAQTARILLRKPSSAYDPTRNNNVKGEQRVQHKRKSNNSG